MICPHGKSGCNYPEGECVGNCFQPLKPKEYRYVDAKVKSDTDWRTAFINYSESLMQLATALETVLMHPDKAYEMRGKIMPIIQDLKQTIAGDIALAEINKASK